MCVCVQSYYNTSSIYCASSNFTQGAMTIRNTQQLTIIHSIYRENGGEEASRLNAFQGGSGGLSINYESEAQLVSGVFLNINNCTFMQNEAESDQNIQLTPSEFSKGIDFTGRGGAISLLLYNTAPVFGVIQDCRFIGNTAEGYGGAIYIAFSSISRHSIRILSSQFTSNRAAISGGAVTVIHIISNTENMRLNSVEVNNSTFVNNTAPYGGAVYFVASTNQSEWW